MTPSIRCTFSDISERDMDLLFLEEFVCSKTFLGLFTKQAGISNARILEVHSSLTDSVLGESDMTIIIESDRNRIGLLIEDKVDAIAMPEQATRYQLRGEKGVAKGEYDSFFVFIIAPRKYLEKNDEAQKYPYKVAYESVLSYFESIEDARASFKIQQIKQAIEKQKKGYQVEVDPAVTDFWRKYAQLQKEQFSDTILNYNGEVKGANATWPRFNTIIEGLYMYHKTEVGFIDLTFDGCADRIVEIDRLLKESIGDYALEEFSIHKTGKAAAVRLRAPRLDLHKTFEEQNSKVENCLQLVRKMTDIAKSFPLETVMALLQRL